MNTKIIIYFLLALLLHSKIYSQSYSLISPPNNYTTSDSVIIFEFNKLNTFDTVNLKISLDSNLNNLIIDTIFNSSDIYINLTFGTYYWQGIFHVSDTIIYSSIRKLNIFSPKLINNKSLWLCGDSNITTNTNNLVEQWGDLFNNYTAKQSLEQYKPKLFNNNPKFNFHNIIHFTSNYLDMNNVLNVDSIKSYTVVFRQTYLVNHGYITNKGMTSLGSFCFGTINNSNSYKCIIDGTVKETNINTDTLCKIISIELFPDSIYKCYKNSNLIYFNTLTSSLNNTNSANFYIGGRGASYFFSGDIAEIIIYSEPLNDSLRTLVEQYLRYKYAPPVSLGYNIYKQDFCPTTLDAGGRFTSYLWNTGDTTQTIQVTHTGTYSVTVTDIFGFQSSDSVFVQYPEPNIPFGDTILCYGDTLTWDLQLDSTLYSFSWSNGDTTRFTQIYNPGGNFFCTITDTAGCQMITDTITVSIDSFPVQPLFIPHDTSICAGTNLYPTSQQIYNALWNTGDTTLFITVPDSGTYTLSAENLHGCHTTDSINVNIHGVAPLIDFTWDNHCIGDSTSFSNLSQVQDTSTFTSFVWQIDSLQTDTAFQTSVLFPDTLTYQITLEGYTSSNCYNITSKQIKIYPTPQVSFTQPHICQHSQATITPQINSAYQIENYLWQLDNTETSTTPNFIHTFDSVATHNISISITDENGCSGKFSSTVEVLPSPVTNFYTTTLCQNRPVIFHDSTITEFYNPIVSSLWDINNITLEGGTISYIFDSSGYFLITHLVTAVNGCKDTITKNIRIYPTPDMQMPDTTYLCANTKETLSVQIPDTILPVTYSWSIDSTLFSNESCPQILFTDTGDHKLEVTTATTHNCTDTKASVINVLPQPSADFNIYLGTYPVTDNYLWSGATYRAVAYDTSYQHYFWSSYQLDYPEYENMESDKETNFQTGSENGMIVLRVVDQNGCQDTSYFSYHTYSPIGNLEFEILNISYTQKGDFIFPIVTLKNKVNSPASPFITCELKGSGKIMEQVDKVIYPGNSYTYSFRSGIEQNREPLVLCAYIVYPWLNNYNHNSEKCITDNYEQIKIMNIYPQPADNELNIDFIFNIGNGDIYFYFTNSLGKRTAYFSKTVSKGYNHLTLDIHTLPAGEYFINIIAGSQSIIRKFIKK